MSTFFGVQVAIEIARNDQARDHLESCVRHLRITTDLLSLRAGWARATDVLRERMAAVRFGSWDLLREDADSHYDTWASELEAMADWPAEDFGADGGLLLVTVIALVRRPSAADTSLGEICDLPERDWQKRATYQRLLTAMPKLAFGDVRGSALYVAPHPDQPGFATEVLTGEGFEYLRPVAD